METCSSPALPKPRPPVVGEVNHHSIKLCWEAERPAQRSGPQERWLRFSVEEEDAKRHTFGIIYTGYATQHVVEGLEPRTLYRFRLKVTSPTGESEYSPVVAVSTTREPLSSEHLHRAVTMNDEELLVRVLQGRLVKILVQNGTDVSGRNSSGKDSLMLACYSGHLDIVQYLRAHGASWEARDLGGCTALHWAADGGHCHVIEWMLQDGCKVNVLDAVSGWSPLMRVSAVSGHRDVASLLIEAGADVNVRDKDGKTPLMVAVLNNHEELVQLLLDKGADPNVTNEVTPAGRDTRGGGLGGRGGGMEEGCRRGDPGHRGHSLSQFGKSVLQMARVFGREVWESPSRVSTANSGGVVYLGREGHAPDCPPSGGFVLYLRPEPAAVAILRLPTFPRLVALALAASMCQDRPADLSGESHGETMGECAGENRGESTGESAGVSFGESMRRMTRGFRGMPAESPISSPRAWWPCWRNGSRAPGPRSRLLPEPRPGPRGPREPLASPAWVLLSLGRSARPAPRAPPPPLPRPPAALPRPTPCAAMCRLQTLLSAQCPGRFTSATDRIRWAWPRPADPTTTGLMPASPITAGP
uniref:Fibronectin type III and ankyrin repeat domains 1 n=1 Tax=Ornithorhynchus anatinus TaxID=9258 RepID=A0A6I8MYT6_ORNAN